MKKRQRFWLAALALSLLLTCAACGKQKAPDADAAPDVKQEQTTGDKKNSTAKTDTTTKSEEKKDETKTEDKISSDQKTGDTKKSEETKKEDAQQEAPKQEEQPKQDIDPDTGKDKYQTDPVPEGKPTPVEPEDTTVDSSTSYTCTFSISCATILNNWDKCDESKKPLVPADGVILPSTTVTFNEGESVFDVLQRICRENRIHMESSWTPMYNSAYVEGIHNLYEFDVGSLSGWMYSVNGWFPNYGCSRYALQNGDVVKWVYTCDLGYDVGGGYATGS